MTSAVAQNHDTRPLRVADLFCGAGGSGVGLAQACEQLGVPYRLTAVNHWEIAIATHRVNHPNVKHLKAEVDKLRSGDLCEDGALDIMWASPSCTEHSYAKGGHSIDDQKRHSAWAIVREVERYRPQIVIVENVPPFRNWGPTEPVFNADGSPKLDKKGEQVRRPIKTRKGEIYRAWFAAMESLGYTGRADLLNAADYGEPQSRVRLFVVFTVPGLEYHWPEPTHGAPDSLEVVAGLREPWRGAREIIKRDLPIESIFERDDPLAENTLSRIGVGADRFWGAAFLLILERHARARGLHLPLADGINEHGYLPLADGALRPLVSGNASAAVPRPDNRPGPTVTAQGGRAMHLYEPVLRPLLSGNSSEAIPRPDTAPAPTVTAQGYQCTFEAEMRPIVGANRTHNVPATDEEPAPNLTTAHGGGLYVAEPTAIVLGQHGGGVARPDSSPMSTIATDGYVRVFEPVIVDVRHGDRPHRPRTGKDPVTTVTSKNGVGVGEALIVSYAERDGKGSGKKVSVPKPAGADPLGTVMTRDRFAVAEPFIVSYHGKSATGGTHVPREMDQPINTVDTNNRFALCVPSLEVLNSLPADAPKERIFVGTDGNLYLLDIRFRMLQPAELARAQGFPEDYVFTGSKSDQTAQIGNAVPVGVARALLREAIVCLGYGSDTCKAA